jgi:hypothetical protein
MDRSPLFAQLEGLNPLNPTAPVSKGSGMVFKDVLLIIMIGLALGLILLLFARIYVRRSKERRHERRTDSPRTVLPEDDEDEGHHHGRRRRHRRRRHRRDHRLRNPTLAETGGLPPPKPPEPSNPPL